MDTKIVVNTILGLFACCLAVLLLSACSLLHHSSDVGRNMTQQQLEKFAHSIKPYAGDAKYHYSLACYLQKRGKHRLAIQEFKEAIKIKPTYATAYNGLGVSYDAVGKYSRAIQAYRTALALQPELDYVLNNLGYSYILQGDFDSAIKVLQRAIALDGNNKRYHNNLGLAYSKKELYEQAFDEFRATEGEAKAHYNVAQMYYEHHLYEKAGGHYAKSLAADPRSRRAREGWEASKALAKIVLRDDKKPSVVASNKVSQSTGESAKMHPDKSRPVNDAPQVSKIVKNIENLYSLRPFEIEISNGNGVRHMARRMGVYLNKRGFSKSFLTNADNFNHARTMIYYRQGYLQKAYRLAKLIPGYQDMEVAGKFSHRQTKMKVVLGKDLISYITTLSKG